MDFPQALDRVTDLTEDELRSEIAALFGETSCMDCGDDDCDGCVEIEGEVMDGRIDYLDNMTALQEEEPNYNVGRGEEYWRCLAYLVLGRQEGPFTLADLAEVAGAPAEARCRALLMRHAIFNDEIL